MTPTAMFTSQERGLPLLRRGKVRDVYRPSDDHLIIIACDRISAFDHVLPTPIPTKGIILTQMSNFWFRETEHLIANHIVDDDPSPGWYPELDWYYEELKGRTVLVKGELGGEADNGVQNPRVWSGQDGVARASYEVTARTVKFLGGREDNGHTPQAPPPGFGEESSSVPF